MRTITILNSFTAFVLIISFGLLLIALHHGGKVPHSTIASEMAMYKAGYWKVERKWCGHRIEVSNLDADGERIFRKLYRSDGDFTKAQWEAIPNPRKNNVFLIPKTWEWEVVKYE